MLESDYTGPGSPRVLSRRSGGVIWDLRQPLPETDDSRRRRPTQHSSHALQLTSMRGVVETSPVGKTEIRSYFVASRRSSSAWDTDGARRVLATLEPDAVPDAFDLPSCRKHWYGGVYATKDVESLPSRVQPSRRVKLSPASLPGCFFVQPHTAVCYS